MKYHNIEMKSIHPEECVVLTWEDAEKAERENHDCGWGFSTPDCLRFIADHMDANYAIEDGEDPTEHYRKQEWIEWRLEDANFHTLCGHLNVHDYNEAIKWVARDM